MSKCNCRGRVAFGEHAKPGVGAVEMWCRACSHRWPDVGERCTVGVLSDVLLPWCPKCGSVQVTPVVSSHACKTYEAWKQAEEPLTAQDLQDKYGMTEDYWEWVVEGIVHAKE